MVVGRDVNDAFREISPTRGVSHFACLRCRLYSTYIAKDLHWLLVAYLCWVQCHYLENFIAILSANITREI